MIPAHAFIRLIQDRCVRWTFCDVFKTATEAKRRAARVYAAGGKGARVIKGPEGLYAVLTWDTK